MTVQDQDTREWELRPSVTEEVRDFVLVLGKNGGHAIHTATCGSAAAPEYVLTRVSIPAWWVEKHAESERELDRGRFLARDMCGNCTVRPVTSE